jgi:hypothetical protein
VTPDQPASSYPEDHDGATDPLPPSEAEPVKDPAERAPASSSDVARDVLVVLGGMAVIGILCGVLWWALVEPSQLVRLQDAVGQDELGLSRDFSATGWYTVIALVAGLLSGLLFGFLRRRDPLVTLFLVLAGCCVAAVLMFGTGYLLGPDDPTTGLETAAVGTRADAPLELHGTLMRIDDLVVYTAYLAWPIGALVGLLIPLLSRTD